MRKEQQKTLPAYKPKEAADYLEVSPSQTTSWRRDGTLKQIATRGGAMLFTAKSVEDLRNERDIKFGVRRS